MTRLIIWTLAAATVANTIGAVVSFWNGQMATATLATVAAMTTAIGGQLTYRLWPRGKH